MRSRRSSLLRFIAEFEDFAAVGEAGSVDEAVTLISTARPAVVFLDIQLGTHSGFDVLEALRGTSAPLVIFTTAYSEHAVRAFEIQALDYLLKPFDRQRFAQCMDKVRSALREPDLGDAEERVRRLLAALPGHRAPSRQVLVRDGERAFFLQVERIDRIAAAGNYVEVHCGGKVHLVRETLAGFIADLDPAEFLRVHRSHVVRVGFIAEIRPLFHGDHEILLRDGQVVALSRRYKVLLPPQIRDRL